MGFIKKKNTIWAVNSFFVAVLVLLFLDEYNQNTYISIYIIIWVAAKTYLHDRNFMYNLFYCFEQQHPTF